MLFLTSLGLFVTTSVTPWVQANLCLDLRGHYYDCEIVANHSENFSFSVAQRTKGVDQLYTATVIRSGKLLSVSLLADANTRQLVADDGQTLAPVDLAYTASCDPVSLVIVATSKALGNSVAEKFRITRAANGQLEIVNETLMLGRTVRERNVTCKTK